MSWQDFVNAYIVNLTDEGKVAYNICDNGCMIGLDNGAIWAQTPGFELKAYSMEIEMDTGEKKTINVNEFESLKDAFTHEGKTEKDGGIRICGEKYFVVSFDGDKNSMYLKKNGGGACVCKSGSALVIGAFLVSKKCKNFAGVEEPQNPGLCNMGCEALQKYLTDNSL